MINELKKYPKAFAEFCEWTVKEHQFIYSGQYNAFMRGSSGTFISDRELQSLLIEWLDSKGIYVLLTIEDDKLNQGEKVTWSWLISLQRKGYLTSLSENNSYQTRSEATTQGIVKAFQLLEEKE